MIKAVNFMLHSNLAWLMHKRYNPKAKNRRTIIMQYIQRNQGQYDDQVQGIIRNIRRCPPHAQMQAYDYWYFATFGEKPCETAITPPDSFLEKVWKSYDEKS